MISMLLALGLLDVGEAAQPGVIVADTEATVIIPRVPGSVSAGDLLPIGAPAWERPLDPSDRAPYAVDWSQFLDVGVKIASIERITMSAAGAAAGVRIEDQAPRRPIIDSSQELVLQLWFSVASASQNSVAFLGAGLKVPVSFLIKTDEDAEEDYERSAILTVRQL